MTGAGRIITAIIAAAVLMSVFAGAAHGAKLVLKESVEVAAREVLVGDVAYISADTEEEKAKIAAAGFCTAPSPGKETTLNERQIIGKLYYAGINPGDHEITVPQKLTVKRKASVITGQELIEKGT